MLLSAANPGLDCCVSSWDAVLVADFSYNAQDLGQALPPSVSISLQ